MSINTRRVVRSLAEERGYTMAKIVDEAVRRGYGTRDEAIAALRNPVEACCAFVPAVEDVLGLSHVESDSLFWTLVEDARAEVRGWTRST